MRVLFIATALLSLAACQTTTISSGGNDVTPEPYRTAKAQRDAVVDVAIKRPDWHAPHNFPVAHPWPGPDLNGLPAGRVFNILKLSERKRIQEDLIMMKLMSGPVDGVWDARTWEGVRQYAARTGMSARLLTERESLKVLRSIAG